MKGLATAAFPVSPSARGKDLQIRRKDFLAHQEDE